MHIKYRTLDHAVCKQGQYGYFQEAIYVSPKNKLTLRAQTQTAFEASNGGPYRPELLNTGPGPVWPVKLKVVVEIHNHEDLEKFLDAAMDGVDALRGEHGEDEAVSPSALHPVFTGMN